MPLCLEEAFPNYGVPAVISPDIMSLATFRNQQASVLGKYGMTFRGNRSGQAPQIRQCGHPDAAPEPDPRTFHPDGHLVSHAN